MHAEHAFPSRNRARMWAPSRALRACALLLLTSGATATGPICTTPSGDTTCNALIDFALSIDNSLSVVNVTGDIAAFAQSFIAYFDTVRTRAVVLCTSQP